jgi:nitrite reductase/ring-hydroxylating ferredoxin subunit
MPAAIRIDLCSTAEVAPGQRAQGRQSGSRACGFQSEWRVIRDRRCLHPRPWLAFGRVREVVECNFHNGQFNIKTGEVVAAPCMIPVKIYKTIVENDRVFIEAE